MKILIIFNLTIFFHFQLLAYMPNWGEVLVDNNQLRIDIESNLEKKDWTGIIKRISLEDASKRKDGLIEFLLATFFLENNYPVHSYALFVSVINNYPTSLLAEKSLVAITKVYKTGYIDTKYLAETLDKRLLNVTQPEAKSIYHYHRAIKLIEKKFSRWALKEIKNIPKGTFWKDEWGYNVLIGKGNNGTADLLLKKITAFSKSKKISSYHHQRAIHDLARLYYELKQFKIADKIYQKVEKKRFDYGEVLREKAWNNLRLGQYEESISHLRKNRSSLYRSYRHPDEFLIAAIIYRETCQENLLIGLSQKLDKVIDEIRVKIDQLDDYSKIEFLSSYAMNSDDLRSISRTLVYLKEEKKLFKENLSNNLSEIVKFSLDKLIEYNMSQFEQGMDSALREIIENFLAIKDQVDYLKYSIRLKNYNEDDKSYLQKVHEIRVNSKNKIIWPISEEIWQDEINNLFSIYLNRCQ